VCETSQLAEVTSFPPNSKFTPSPLPTNSGIYSSEATVPAGMAVMHFSKHSAGTLVPWGNVLSTALQSGLQQQQKQQKQLKA